MSTFTEKLRQSLPRNDDDVITNIYEHEVAFENNLREVFAQDRDNSQISDPHVCLINVFENEDLFKKSELTKQEQQLPQLFPIQEYQKIGTGDACIVNEALFKNHFDLFTEGQMRNFDWNNVFVAGGSVLACLQPLPYDYDTSNAKRREYFHKVAYKTSDVDLFLYGLNSEEEANAKLKQIYDSILESIPEECIAFRSQHAVSIVSQYPYRHIQIVLRLYKSPAEILMGFDVDSCGVGFDGKNVWATARAQRAITKQYNKIDMSRRSPSYEMRLAKYSQRGFGVMVPSLDRQQIDPGLYERKLEELSGLARLLLLEKLRTPELRASYQDQQQLLKLAPENKGRKSFWALLGKEWQDEYSLERLQEEGGTDASDYSCVFLPWGPTWNAKRICKLMFTKDMILQSKWYDPTRNFHQHPCFFGTVEEIIEDCCGSCPAIPPEEIKKDSPYVSGRMTWMTTNPGQQRIGSFHPITEGDWMDGAYVNTHIQKCIASISKDDDVELKKVVMEEVAKGKELGLVVNMRDTLGRRLLHIAALCGAVKCAKQLLALGARLRTRMSDGRTALHLAASNGHSEIIRLIIQRGEQLKKEEEKRKANEKRKKRGGAKKSHHRDEMDEEEGGHDEDEMEDAEDEGEEEEEKEDEDMDDDASVHEETDEGFISIRYKAEMKKKKIHEELASEEDIDALKPDSLEIDTKDWKLNLNPLQYATFLGHDECVKVLIKEGNANTGVMLVQQENNLFGRTQALPLLHLAYASQHISTIKTLIECGIPPNLKNQDGSTLLHIATRSLNLEHVKEFLALGIPVDSRANDGLTPLLAAMYLVGGPFANNGCEDDEFAEDDMDDEESENLKKRRAKADEDRRKAIEIVTYLVKETEAKVFYSFEDVTENTASGPAIIAAGGRGKGKRFCGSSSLVPWWNQNGGGSSYEKYCANVAQPIHLSVGLGLDIFKLFLNKAATYSTPILQILNHYYQFDTVLDCAAKHLEFDPSSKVNTKATEKLKAKSKNPESLGLQPYKSLQEMLKKFDEIKNEDSLEKDCHQFLIQQKACQYVNGGLQYLNGTGNRRTIVHGGSTRRGGDVPCIINSRSEKEKIYQVIVELGGRRFAYLKLTRNEEEEASTYRQQDQIRNQLQANIKNKEEQFAKLQEQEKKEQENVNNGTKRPRIIQNTNPMFGGFGNQHEVVEHVKIVVSPIPESIDSATGTQSHYYNRNVNLKPYDTNLQKDYFKLFQAVADGNIEGVKELTINQPIGSQLHVACKIAPYNRTLLEHAVINRQPAMAGLLVDICQQQFTPFIPAWYEENEVVRAAPLINNYRLAELFSSINPGDFLDRSGFAIYKKNQVVDPNVPVVQLNCSTSPSTYVFCEGGKRNILHLCAELDDKESMQSIIDTCKRLNLLLRSYYVQDKISSKARMQVEDKKPQTILSGMLKGMITPFSTAIAFESLKCAEYLLREGYVLNEDSENDEADEMEVDENDKNPENKQKTQKPGVYQGLNVKGRKHLFWAKKHIPFENSMQERKKKIQKFNTLNSIQIAAITNRPKSLEWLINVAPTIAKKDLLGAFDIKSLTLRSSGANENLLQLAAAYGSVDAMKILLKYDKENYLINSSNNDVNILSYVISNPGNSPSNSYIPQTTTKPQKTIEVIKQMIDLLQMDGFGCDANKKIFNGYNIVHQAVIADDPGVLELIMPIVSKETLNETKRGYSPIHMALWNRADSALDILLKDERVDVFKRSTYLGNILSMSVALNRSAKNTKKILAEYLRRGADLVKMVNEENGAGLTILDIAKLKGLKMITSQDPECQYSFIGRNSSRQDDTLVDNCIENMSQLLEASNGAGSQLSRTVAEVDEIRRVTNQILDHIHRAVEGPKKKLGLGRRRVSNKVADQSFWKGEDEEEYVPKPVISGIQIHVPPIFEMRRFFAVPQFAPYTFGSTPRRYTYESPVQYSTTLNDIAQRNFLFSQLPSIDESVKILNGLLNQYELVTPSKQTWIEKISIVRYDWRGPGVDEFDDTKSEKKIQSQPRSMKQPSRAKVIPDEQSQLF